MEESDVRNSLAGLRVWTIGHSTRPIEEFIEALHANQIATLIDVRQFPGSRKYPQYGKAALSESLTKESIDYIHIVELGGRRKPNPNSENTLWRNESFRAYADYMETKEFEAGIDRAIKFATEKPTAIMCAEAVWWRCHRSLISDYLKSRGAEVIHIINATKTEIHPYTSAARIIDGRLSYRKYV